MELYSININEITEKDYEMLSAFRKQRADKCKLNNDRLRSVAAGVLLNRGLKKYNLSERDMNYSQNSYGKPYFTEYPKINFSISHSCDMCIVCFSDREIGCDIEKIETADMKIADRFFEKAEKDFITNSKDINSAFYKIWTLKESYIKAVGKGLSMPLNSFSVFDVSNYSFKQYFENGYSISVCERINISF